MKLELLNTTVEKMIMAVDYFKKCPKCGGELSKIHTEVICSACEWNSAAWTVDREFACGFMYGARVKSINRRSKVDQYLCGG